MRETAEQKKAEAAVEAILFAMGGSVEIEKIAAALGWEVKKIGRAHV